MKCMIWLKRFRGTILNDQLFNIHGVKERRSERDTYEEYDMKLSLCNKITSKKKLSHNKYYILNMHACISTYKNIFNGTFLKCKAATKTLLLTLHGKSKIKIENQIIDKD